MELERYTGKLGMLEAQRTLDRVASVAAGSRMMQERDQRQYMRSLQRAASGGRQSGVQKATAASLAQLGIAVETVPAAEAKKAVRKRGAVKKA